MLAEANNLKPQRVEDPKMTQAGLLPKNQTSLQPLPSEKKLLVIDPRVQDYQMLAAGVPSGVQVQILETDIDGVDQITQALARDIEITSLHIVGHGAPGRLYIGRDALTQDNIASYSHQLQEWGVTEIILYACNVSQETSFAELLHQLTAAEVRSSAGRVGNETLGGTWQLESRFPKSDRPIELAFKPEIIQNYPGVFVSFQDAIDFPTGDSSRTVSVGDFNGDGNLDLAVANSDSNNVSVLLGNGEGNFSEPAQLVAGNAPYYVAVGFLNGDGFLDLAVANIDSNNVSVLLGNGNGTFDPRINFTTGSQPRSIALGDFDGDGNLDLAVANRGDNNVSVLLGAGDGSFAGATNFPVEEAPVPIAVADFNGDGNLDITVANRVSNSASVLLGAGDGSFGNAINLDVGEESGPRGIAVADFDGDGNSDIVMSNYDSDNVSVLLGVGNGSFSEATNFNVRNGPQSVAVADLDADGNIDIVTGNKRGSTVSVLLGAGDGTFASDIRLDVTGGPEFIAVAELNNYGGLDLVTANRFGDDVSVLLTAATVEFSQATYQVNEDGSFTSFDITINRSGDISGTSTVEVQLSDGTATGGTPPEAVDFDNSTIALEFAPEQTTATIAIPINDDDIAEDTENLTLTLANLSIGTQTGNQGTATLEIIDNDDVVNPVNLDIDDNGETDALTDGILAIRYLFGFTGDALIQDAIAPDATRTTASEITAYLDRARDTMLDVDSNGMADALTDGILTIRYLFGFTGDALIQDAIAPDATRTDAASVLSFLQSFDLV
ncbi:MAG: FG-GAP-like repeat-containing protein [Hormoscilla sp.]